MSALEIRKDLEKIFEKAQEGRYDMSASRFVESFVKPFDKELIAPMSAKKLGITTEEVLKLWEEKAEKGRLAGSVLHKHLENSFTGSNKPTGLDGSVISTYMKNDPEYRDLVNNNIRLVDIFYDTVKEYLAPMLVEHRVADEDLSILGIPDYLFQDLRTGNLILFDLKHGKPITDKGKNKMLGPFCQVKDGNLQKNSLQLSFYKFIIERNSSYQISDMIIGHIGDKYNSYRALDMQDIIAQYYS